MYLKNSFFTKTIFKTVFTKHPILLLFSKINKNIFNCLQRIRQYCVKHCSAFTLPGSQYCFNFPTQWKWYYKKKEIVDRCYLTYKNIYILHWLLSDPEQYHTVSYKKPKKELINWSISSISNPRGVSKWNRK